LSICSLVEINFLFIINHFMITEQFILIINLVVYFHVCYLIHPSLI